MACRKQALVIIFLISLITLSFSQSHLDDNNNSGGIAVYWGQDGREDDLKSTCNSGNYAIVLLAFLNRFGSGRTPTWQFLGQCDLFYEGGKRCTELEPEIKHCQAKGIKVFLSIGGHPSLSDYSLNSTEDAKVVANYLHTNFLSGQFGPLGSVYLDGIDFNIQVTTDHWEDLARELDFFRRNTESRYFHLSAAPRCPIPVSNLGKAIETKLFDYIFVLFYNNPRCESSYRGDTGPLLESWDEWVGLVASNNSLFVGLPATLSIGTGFVPPTLVNRVVLPHVKRASNYGGVMLWDRYHDRRINFSGRILPNVLKSRLLPVSDA